MSEQRSISPLIESSGDRKAEAREIVGANRRDVTLADIDTASMAGDLRDLFDHVMSGKPYDEKQVKNATNLINTIVKVLRFEFDVYKHFVKDTAQRPVGRPKSDTIAKVAEWLRGKGDKIEKGAGIGLWTINGYPCEEKDLILRANDLRIKLNMRPFEIEQE